MELDQPAASSPTAGIVDLRAPGCRRRPVRRGRGRPGCDSSGRSSAMMPHMAEWPSRLRTASVEAGAPDRVLVAPRIGARHRERPAGRLQAPLGAADEAARLRRSRRTPASGCAGPRGPAMLPRSSSNRPTTVPNGCIISRLPTRPEEFARPSGSRRGEQQQPRRADAVGREDRDRRRWTVLVAVRGPRSPRPVTRPSGRIISRRTRAPVTQLDARARSPAASA